MTSSRPSSSQTGAGDTEKKPGFQPLVPVVKDEDEDSDKDMLVVDETPRAQQANRKNSAAKPGSLRVKLSSKCGSSCCCPNSSHWFTTIQFNSKNL